MKTRTLSAAPEHILSLVAHVFSLRGRTDPLKGSGTTAGKHARTGDVLLAFDLLYKSLFEWAVYHRIGVLLKRLTLTEISEDKADSHEFEQLGHGWTPDGSAESREILASFILQWGIVPTTARGLLAEALRALNVGETQPLLTPSPAGHWHGARSLANARRTAIMHVHFRWGRKTHIKKKAVEEVANALGVGSETLRTWERRWLPSMESDVSKVFVLAKRAGIIQHQIDKDPDYKPDDPLADTLRLYLTTGGTLDAVAREHRSALEAARGKADRVG